MRHCLGCYRLLWLWAFLLSAAWAHAGFSLDTDNPAEFFTNVAARLLKSEMNLDLDRIQVHPTSQYTPAVHRLLQVTANLYDSTTTNFYPTIFRPIVSTDGTNVYISGYEEVDTTNTSFLTVPVDLNEAVNRGRISNDTRINIYGMPWIIGAKKGLPNFNQVALQSVAQLTRILQMTRPSTNTLLSSLYRIRQALIIGVSNVLGVEVWNSYSNNYPRAAYIQADGDLSITLTNDVGLPSMVLNLTLGGANLATNMGAITLAANAWPGTGWTPGDHSKRAYPESFKAPLLTNIVFLPDSVYQHSPLALVPLPADGSMDWSTIATNYFPQPHWGLSIAGHVRCLILDGGPPGQGRVVDYVQLSGLNTFRDLGGELDTYDPSYHPFIGISNLWSTNLVNSRVGTNVPLGVANQINVSVGSPQASDSAWSDQMIGAPSSAAKQWAIDRFRTFMRLTPMWNVNMINTDLVEQVPFTPTSKKYQLLTWQANDPLVHYTARRPQGRCANEPAVCGHSTRRPVSPPATTNFFWLNDRYEPWGGNPKWGLLSELLHGNQPGSKGSRQIVG